MTGHVHEEQMGLPPCPDHIELDDEAKVVAINAWLMTEQLRSLGVANLVVTYEGSWDCQKDLQTDHDAADEKLLEKQVSVYVANDDVVAVFDLETMSLKDAFDTVVDQIAGVHNPDYEFEHGGGGTISFSSTDNVVQHRTFEFVEATSEEPAGSSTEPFAPDPHSQDAVIAFDGNKLVGDKYKVVNRRLLLGELKKMGVTELQFSYSGEGDDGSMDYSHIIGADIDKLDKEMTFFEPSGQLHSDQIYKVAYELSRNLLSWKHSGFEAGNGGSGNLTLNVVDGVIVWNGYNNVDADNEKVWSRAQSIPCLPPPQPKHTIRP